MRTDVPLNTTLLTINEARSRLRLSRGSVYKLINAGRLPTVRLCGRTLVREADLVALVIASIPEAR